MFVQSNPILGRFCFAMVWGGRMCQYWVRERERESTRYNIWVNFASNDRGKACIWVMGSLSFAIIRACNTYLLWSHGHTVQQFVRSPFFNEGSDVYIKIWSDASILPTPEIHIWMPQKLSHIIITIMHLYKEMQQYRVLHGVFLRRVLLILCLHVNSCHSTTGIHLFHDFQRENCLPRHYLTETCNILMVDDWLLRNLTLHVAMPTFILPMDAT